MAARSGAGCAKVVLKPISRVWTASHGQSRLQSLGAGPPHCIDSVAASTLAGPSSRPWCPQGQVRHASTSSHDATPGAAAPSTQEQGGQKAASPGFFDSQRPTAVPSALTEDVRELYRLLYPAEREQRADPNAIWTLYVRLCSQSANGSFGIDALNQEALHRVVMSMVSTGVSSQQPPVRSGQLHTRRLESEGSASSDLSQEIILGDSVRGPRPPSLQSSGARDAKDRITRRKVSQENAKVASLRATNRIYAHRARFVMQQAKQTEYRAGKHPLAIHSYNSILEHAAIAGDVNLLRDTWRQLRHSTDGPSANSYRYFMLGLDSHAQGLERAIEKGGSSATFHREKLGRTALRAVRLIDQMLASDVPVEPSMLEWVARMLSKAGHLPWLKKFVKSWYAVDLDAPDALVSLQALHTRPRPLSTHVLNTVIDAMGEHATVSQMIATWESLTHPLPRDESPVALEEGGAFKTSWRGLFQNDDDSDLVAHEIAKSASGSAADGQLRPNKFTFERLLHHSCFSPIDVEESKFSQLPAAKQAECTARDAGSYVAIAKYLLDDALAFYEAEIRRVAGALGMKLVPAVAADHAVAPQSPLHPALEDEKSSQEDAASEDALPAETTAPEVQDRSGAQTRACLVSEPLSADALEATAVGSLAAATLPFIDPPVIQPGPQLFTALWRHAQKQRNPGTFAWLRERVSRASSLMRSERLLMVQAEHHWNPDRVVQLLVAARGSGDERLLQKAARISTGLKYALRRQKRFVSGEITDLMVWDDTRVRPRLEFLRGQVAQRQSRRRQTLRARSAEEELAQQERERQKQRARARKLEEASASSEATAPTPFVTAGQI
ncbi:unnamed protein product [Parajaminaea phylloscopi]